MAPKKIFALGALSGAHIGFGAFLMVTVGAACPGLASTNPGLQKAPAPAAARTRTLPTRAHCPPSRARAAAAARPPALTPSHALRRLCALCRWSSAPSGCRSV